MYTILLFYVSSLLKKIDNFLTKDFNKACWAIGFITLTFISPRFKLFLAEAAFKMVCVKFL
jgi:hypothetical protein